MWHSVISTLCFLEICFASFIHTRQISKKRIFFPHSFWDSLQPQPTSYAAAITQSLHRHNFEEGLIVPYNSSVLSEAISRKLIGFPRSELHFVCTIVPVTHIHTPSQHLEPLSVLFSEQPLESPSCRTPPPLFARKNLSCFCSTPRAANCTGYLVCSKKVA